MTAAARKAKTDTEARRVANVICSGQIATVERAVLKELLLNVGGSVMSRGVMCRVDSRHLGAGVYEVRLVPQDTAQASAAHAEARGRK